MQLADIISSFGVSFILITFFLSIFKVIKTDSLLYYVANMIGGALACYGSILLHSVPFTILEGTWALVALIGLIKLLINTKHTA